MSSPALSSFPTSRDSITSSNSSTLSASPLLNQSENDTVSKSARFILDYQAALGSIAKKYNSSLASLIFRPFSFTLENKERHPHEGISELSKPGALLKTLKVAAEKLRIELNKKDLDSDEKNILSEEFSSIQNLVLKQVDAGFSIQQINIEDGLKAGIFDANKQLCYGLIYYFDQQIYEGTFYKNGNIQEGTAIFPFLQTFEGTFSENRQLLKGKIIFPDGTIYDENGRLRKGKKTFSNAIYEGTFDEEGRLREGKMIFSGGMIYEGVINENGRLQKGTATFPNGNIHEGTFHENGWLKTGTITLPNRIILEGMFDENRRLLNGKIIFPDGQIHENEKPQEGKITFPSGEIQEGTFENGWLREGKKIFPSKEIQEGTFDENGWLQKGKKTLSNGEIYEGTFDENGWIREGKWTLPNKEIQEGTFDESGNLLKGKRTLSNGEIYEGTFDENGLLREGKRTLSNGTIYEGTFDENGLLREGKRTFSNGTIYEGTFENGKLQKGKKTLSNREIQEGTFYESGGLREGKKTFPDGKIQEGTFDENGRLLEGKMAFPNGETQEGTFDENGRLREGKKFFPNGTIYEGTFENGRPLNGKAIFPDGEIHEGFFVNRHLHEGEKRFLNGFVFNGEFSDNELKKGVITLPNGMLFPLEENANISSLLRHIIQNLIKEGSDLDLDMLVLRHMQRYFKKTQEISEEERLLLIEKIATNKQIPVDCSTIDQAIKNLVTAAETAITSNTPHTHLFDLILFLSPDKAQDLSNIKNKLGDATLDYYLNEILFQIKFNSAHLQRAVKSHLPAPPDIELEELQTLFAATLFTDPANIKPETLLKQLSELLDKIKSREPYTGTPLGPKGDLELEAFFDTLSNALKHVTFYIKKLHEEATPKNGKAQEAETLLLHLSDIAGYCGTRHHAEALQLFNLTRTNSAEVIDLTLEGKVFSELQSLRRSLIHKESNRIVSSKNLGEQNHVHVYNSLMHHFAEAWGLSSYGPTYNDPLAPKDLDFNAIKNTLERAYQKECLNSIGKVCLEEPFRSQMIEWIKANTPDDWESEYDAVKSKIQKMSTEGSSLEEMTAALKEYEIPTGEESPLESIEEVRRHSYLESCIEITEKGMLFKKRILYRMLQHFNIF